MFHLVPTLVAGSIAAAAGAISHATFVPGSRLWGPLVCRGSAADPPRVALTFDDGPVEGSTNLVLDTLGELGVKAAFFLIGKNVERAPDLLRRIDAEGHLIGNHTFDHSHWGVFGFSKFWLEQITRTDDAIAAVIGRQPRLFRPPVGHKTLFTRLALNKTGHKMVTWNARSYDGLQRATTQGILDRLLPRCRAGDIVTLHDGVDPNSRRDARATVAAVKPLILGLRARGLEPVRLDEIAGL